MEILHSQTQFLPLLPFFRQLWSFRNKSKWCFLHHAQVLTRNQITQLSTYSTAEELEAELFSGTVVNLEWIITQDNKKF